MASVASPLNIPLARDIPTTFTTSFAQWWSSGTSQSAISEERLFRRLPFYRAAGDSTPPTGGVVGRLGTVELSGKGRYLNMFTISPVESDSKQVATSDVPPAVFLPGYGAGMSLFIVL
jgi:cardiolipin-specific phospholipase